MKRLFNLMLCVFAVSLASCDDGESEYVQESHLRIVSRDVDFPAAASQGFVEVEAPGAVTVTASGQGWCTASVSGTTIQVNVEENPGLDSRSSMLTIRCGADTTCIAVTQSGIIFSLKGGTSILVGDGAADLSYDMACNVAFSCTASDSWISVTPDLAAGKLNVRIEANNTGHIRTGGIDYKAGSVEGRIPVTQYDFAKDIAGDYRLLFIDPDDGKTYYLDARLTATALELPDIEMSIPVKVSGASVSISGGARMGTYQNYYIFTVLWDTEQGYLTWNPDVSVTAAFEYVEEEGVGYTVAAFEDNGSWSGYFVDAICFEAFSSQTPSTASRVGDMMALIYPTLQREHGGAAAAARTATRTATAAPWKADAPRKAAVDGLRPVKGTVLTAE